MSYLYMAIFAITVLISGVYIYIRKEDELFRTILKQTEKAERRNNVWLLP